MVRWSIDRNYYNNNNNNNNNNSYNNHEDAKTKSKFGWSFDMKNVLVTAVMQVIYICDIHMYEYTHTHTHTHMHKHTFTHTHMSNLDIFITVLLYV